ncbi:pyridoxal 5'-phosphate synthase lyase subunit PdxS [Candidatus Borrarchaeum sp.]|uniref:pyridoxal 5'-phosphate synthase lyase subunit PdxS n=1 Tax=Candidatus Borrarchaeum sp. TaxID=2846742 RepID=UPI002579FC37|nr:pyridoxal 5'-phosphate synthase lyase subunit PdxS [Candidatus Borrarchaeum sp.]
MISFVSTVSEQLGIRCETFEEFEIIRGTTLVKRGFACMLKHGVIMDVTNVEQAQIAEDAGAVAVMVLDRLPYDVRKTGGIARTASLKAIEEILDHVTIPVMAKCRIGHSGEAKILETVGIDMIDESEVLTPADETRHIWKWDFTTPFVDGARSLGEALRRVEEGAAMIRTKGEPGTGDVAEAVKHLRLVNNEIRAIKASYESEDHQELIRMARDLKACYELVAETGRLGRLPVVNFAAGGIATPADAALMINLGCDGIFVGSGIFKSEDPSSRAEAIVLATTFFDDPSTVAEAQKMIDEKKSMVGLESQHLKVWMQERGAT